MHNHGCESGKVLQKHHIIPSECLYGDTGEVVLSGAKQFTGRNKKREIILMSVDVWDQIFIEGRDCVVFDIEKREKSYK